jgi:5'(3')-deoxyribonucleotidase
MAKQIYYFDMDGVLCNFHKEPYKYENATNREWIANLDPFIDNVNLVRKLITEGKSVYILTAGANNEARKGKLDWLAKYIPELNKKRFICIVGSKGRKVDKRKTKGGMLIDDKMANLKPWAKEGLPIYWVKERGARVEL